LPARRSSVKQKPKRRTNPFVAFLQTVFVIGIVAVAIGVGYVGASVALQLRDLPDVSIVEKYEPIEAIQIFDRYDHLICTVEGDEDRRVVPLNQVSVQMQQAILAAEDHHFFEHHGVNFASIFRASLANFQAGHVVEGGSTITQQLCKNLFFTEAGRTFDRKVKEAFVAYELEQRYTKEKILEMYLNQVYFGNNAYGIERAASRYFDKSAAEISLAQAAFLAGLVKAPSELGAINNRAAAIARQHEILGKMVEYGYITEDQEKKALKTKLVFRRGANPLQKYPYYISYVIEILHEKFTQADMRSQGLRVYTNLDPIAQDIAEKTMNDDIKKAPKGVTQGALVSVSVPTGAVITMVGGVGNYWQNQFNRATNPHTAGSSFKPFVYLTAFLKGIANPDTLVDDKPLVVKQPYGLPDYAPKNYDKKFLGRIPMRKALALSRNVPAVRTAQLAGMDSIVETARLAGVSTKLDPNLSLALGSSAVTPLDMAGAYSTFARAGVAIKPQVLRKIEDNKGQVIEVFESKVDKVFNVEPVAELVDVMQDVVRYGTGAQAKLADRPVAGKTGTADAAKDIWFIGFTPDLVTAVWGGNDENLPIPGTHVTGGDVMAKIWRDYNEAYYKAYPSAPGSFIAPNIQKIAPAPGGDQLAAKKIDDHGNEIKATTLSPLQPEVPKVDVISGDTGLMKEAPTPADGNPMQAPSISAGQPVNSAPMPSLAPERAAPVQTVIPTPAPRRLYPASGSEPSEPRLYPSGSEAPSARLLPAPNIAPVPATPNQ
jgi:1A family penicillin-binding protein